MIGLAGLSEQPVEEVLLLSPCPAEERSGLLAAAHVVRNVVGPAVRIIAASPHPSEEWLQAVLEAGIEDVWWVEWPRRQGARQRSGRSCTLGIEGEVCPALHARSEEGKTLSVCGRHRDRMVLASHHLERWCLYHHETCPHWKFGPGWLEGDDA